MFRSNREAWSKFPSPISHGYLCEMHHINNMWRSDAVEVCPYCVDEIPAIPFEEYYINGAPK